MLLFVIDAILVAVSAFPVTAPVTLPTTLPDRDPVTCAKVTLALVATGCHIEKAIVSEAAVFVIVTPVPAPNVNVSVVLSATTLS